MSGRGATNTPTTGLSVRPTWDEMKLLRDGRLSIGSSAKARPAVEENPLSVLGRKACGCAVAWCSGALPTREIRAEIRKWERDGLTIEMVTVEDARVALSVKCTHKGARP